MNQTVIGVFVDDKIEQTIYEKAFQRIDHRIEGHVFTTPEQGFETAKHVNFDVVFIEIHFWGENFGGISILEQLKKITGRNIIGIAVTSFLQDGDIQKIIESGFSMCIEKPMTAEALEIFCGQAAYN
jgi:CheY-like chemotaxis protein